MEINTKPSFADLDTLLARFAQLGAKKIFCKFLAENDNSKQQIYLGGSFEVLKQLVFGQIKAHSDLKTPNFKAPVPLYWIDAQGQTEAASGTQLILYPKYPEIRLSGFLNGCTIAPNASMQVVPKANRRFNNGSDGRVLFLAVSDDKVFAFLALADSLIANELASTPERISVKAVGALREIISLKAQNSRTLLLDRLRLIHAAGWHNSMRLDKFGMRVAYQAPNGGGYTLEALFGIVPNSRAAPDFDGWEIKGYSNSRITLMTPEPNAGYYGEHGVAEFLRKYGRRLPNDVIYFTGTHRCGIKSEASGQTLITDGFNIETGEITNVDGGLHLIDSGGELSAAWTFSGLIDHWCRKHSAAVYVPYESSGSKPPEYKYKSPVTMAEGSTFNLFLAAIASGEVIYDPAPKLTNASSLKSKAKARSQFRINFKNLNILYERIEQVELS